jgi:hypothetical protein
MRFSQAVAGWSSVSLAVLLVMVRAQVRPEYAAQWNVIAAGAVVVGACGLWLAIDVAAWWLAGCPSVAEIQRRKVARAYEQGCEDTLDRWADAIQADADADRERSSQVAV